jgi:hypothetical protein
MGGGGWIKELDDAMRLGAMPRKAAALGARWPLAGTVAAPFPGPIAARIDPGDEVTGPRGGTSACLDAVGGRSAVSFGVEGELAGDGTADGAGAGG